MTLDEEIGVALGQMGMSLESYLALTPFQFQTAYQKFIERIKSDREHDDLAAWQVARWQVWRTLCPPAGKKLSLMDIIELPGDRKQKASPARDESRFRALAEKWK